MPRGYLLNYVPLNVQTQVDRLPDADRRVVEQREQELADAVIGYIKEQVETLSSFCAEVVEAADGRRRREEEMLQRQQDMPSLARTSSVSDDVGMKPLKSSLVVRSNLKGWNSSGSESDSSSKKKRVMFADTTEVSFMSDGEDYASDTENYEDINPSATAHHEIPGQLDKPDNLDEVEKLLFSESGRSTESPEQLPEEPAPASSDIPISTPTPGAKSLEEEAPSSPSSSSSSSPTPAPHSTTASAFSHSSTLDDEELFEFDESLGIGSPDDPIKPEERSYVEHISDPLVSPSLAASLPTTSLMHFISSSFRPKPKPATKYLPDDSSAHDSPRGISTPSTSTAQLSTFASSLPIEITFNRRTSGILDNSVPRKSTSSDTPTTAITNTSNNILRQNPEHSIGGFNDLEDEFLLSTMRPTDDPGTMSFSQRMKWEEQVKAGRIS